jgi:hypothetical protein
MQPHMRGVILTPSMHIIPNFSLTPRVVCSSSFVAMMMNTDGDKSPLPLAVLPAVNARLVRMFHVDGSWMFATNRGVRAKRTAIITRFRQAVECQTGQPFQNTEQRLAQGRVWFFLLPREGSPNVYIVGSTEMLTLRPPTMPPVARTNVRGHHWVIDGDSSLRAPDASGLEGIPCIPSLRSVLASSGHSDTCNGITAWQTARLDAETLRYVDQYNGILVLNTETLVAMRVVDPLAFLLGRLVEGRERNPRSTIVRVLLTHYIIGGNAFENFYHRMHLVFAVHAALGALSFLFPAEYSQCADRVFVDMRDGALSHGIVAKSGTNLTKLVNSIVATM